MYIYMITALLVSALFFDVNIGRIIYAITLIYIYIFQLFTETFTETFA